eukprot:TRINITY_DN67192_c6_g2_i1.p4 TRINITY_DN67192_c6_g2~~TRINITY_DN67192_c6_g2_i1.p4  ORF type:complete len:152 (+),score=28.97 TRINITY_DN67192_c6_g2_i1:43-498(+)
MAERDPFPDRVDNLWEKHIKRETEGIEMPRDSVVLSHQNAPTLWALYSSIDQRFASPTAFQTPPQFIGGVNILAHEKGTRTHLRRPPELENELFVSAIDERNNDIYDPLVLNFLLDEHAAKRINLHEWTVSCRRKKGTAEDLLTHFGWARK